MEHKMGMRAYAYSEARSGGLATLSASRNTANRINQLPRLLQLVCSYGILSGRGTKTLFLALPVRYPMRRTQGL